MLLANLEETAPDKGDALFADGAASKSASFVDMISAQVRAKTVDLSEAEEEEAPLPVNPFEAEMAAFQSLLDQGDGLL